MKKIYLIGFGVVLPFLLFGAYSFMHPEFKNQALFSKERRDGHPLISVFKVDDSPLKINFGYANAIGELWLVKVNAELASSSDKNLMYLIPITNSEPFYGDISFKNYEKIPETGDYYLSILSSSTPFEPKSDFFSVYSSAPSIKKLNAETQTISTGDSAKITWNTTNTKDCSLTLLNEKTNENVVLQSNLPPTGSVSVTPTVSTYYSLSCTSTEDFKNVYVNGQSIVSESILIFVN